MYETKVGNRLYQFRKRNYLSFSEMERVIKTKYQDVKIFTTKLSGANMVREMYTTDPTGNPPVYDYEAEGYWVLWDRDSFGYRTVVLKNIEKIIVDGQTFYVE
jgi:hypothetical protein